MNWKEFFKPDWKKIILTILLLIISLFIFLRLFTSIVRMDTLPKIDDFQQVYNYNRERIRCGNLCNTFTSNGCTDMMAAVSYCREKVSVDINGDGRTGNKGAYGVVAGTPYCEDGLYCFHMYECSCGNFTLDSKNCLSLMCDFYKTKNLDSQQTWNSIQNDISYGSCELNPNNWQRFIPGMNGYTFYANWWWIYAGYNSSSCEDIKYQVPPQVMISERKYAGGIPEPLSLVMGSIFIFLIFPSFFFLFASASPIIILIGITVQIFWFYFLSCLSVWIYSKFKKKR
jgi:hypothetical protein